MKKIKQVLNAIIGYAGSSEAPQKMSMRFMGIITGIISQLSPIIALVVSKMIDLPNGVSATAYVGGLSNMIEPIVLSFACILWIIGAVRAVMATPKVAGFLRN